MYRTNDDFNMFNSSYQAMACYLITQLMYEIGQVR